MSGQTCQREQFTDRQVRLVFGAGAALCVVPLLIFAPILIVFLLVVIVLDTARRLWGD